MPQKGQPITDNNTAVVKAFEQFKESAFDKNYYDYSLLFQLMDDTREAYMKLHEVRNVYPAMVKETAEYLSQPVAIAKGRGHIRLPQYIKMESVMLRGKEPERFEAFGQALEDDAKIQVAKNRPANGMMIRQAAGIVLTTVTTEGLEKALQVMKDVKAVSKQIKEKAIYPVDADDNQAAGFIFESFMPVMDGYNQLRGIDATAAKAVGNYIAGEKFVTKDGQQFDIIGFIQMHISQFPVMYDQLDDFKDHLREDVSAMKS